MPDQTRVVAPGKIDGTVIADSGTILTIPLTWSLLKPGDAGATRRVKAAGPSWTVKAKRGRRIISLGVWAPTDTIDGVIKGLEAERSTDAYKKKQTSAKRRRDKTQVQYVEDFTAAVFEFLAFHDRHKDLAMRLASAIAAHATPVGSGTVARAARIPVEQRAESAVIAWLRHQTTGYDNMKIPRLKGKRREVRRILAAKSRELLDVYRRDAIVSVEKCLLEAALAKSK
jgi:hypothetical protein